MHFLPRFRTVVTSDLSRWAGDCGMRGAGDWPLVRTVVAGLPHGHGAQSQGRSVGQALRLPEQQSRRHSGPRPGRRHPRRAERSG